MRKERFQWLGSFWTKEPRSNIELLPLQPPTTKGFMTATESQNLSRGWHLPLEICHDVDVLQSHDSPPKRKQWVLKVNRPLCLIFGPTGQWYQWYLHHLPVSPTVGKSAALTNQIAHWQLTLMQMTILTGSRPLDHGRTFLFGNDARLNALQNMSHGILMEPQPFWGNICYVFLGNKRQFPFCSKCHLFINYQSFCAHSCTLFLSYSHIANIQPHFGFSHVFSMFCYIGAILLLYEFMWILWLVNLLLATRTVQISPSLYSWHSSGSHHLFDSFLSPAM